MIKNDEEIQHSLLHMEIGAGFITKTIIETGYTKRSLTDFFAQLRQGHGAALSQYDSGLAEVIGGSEHHELDHLGPFGIFAGRMAVRESGFALVEKVLHTVNDPSLQTALQGSLASAVGALRSAG